MMFVPEEILKIGKIEYDPAVGDFIFPAGTTDKQKEAFRKFYEELKASKGKKVRIEE